jgi:hypothetical protein
VKVFASLASFPGLHLHRALDLLGCGISEPLWGAICDQQVQLVPQTLDCLTEEIAGELRDRWPGRRFRLHANARVLPQHRLADLSNLQRHMDWLSQAARISQLLGAPAYTAHAGRRRDADLSTMFDNARRAADHFCCPVGVEGMYPASGDPWLVSTWPEYRQLLDSGLPFALDLSHIHILAVRTRRRESALLAEMLACANCIEVHVSDNDGRADQHHPCQETPWWACLLEHINPGAVVFSEGNQRRLVSKDPS